MAHAMQPTVNVNVFAADQLTEKIQMVRKQRICLYITHGSNWETFTVR